MFANKAVNEITIGFLSVSAIGKSKIKANVTLLQKYAIDTPAVNKNLNVWSANIVVVVVHKIKPSKTKINGANGGNAENNVLFFFVTALFTRNKLKNIVKTENVSNTLVHTVQSGAWLTNAGKYVVTNVLALEPNTTWINEAKVSK